MHALAIIPAAGSGTRFGAEIPKQYLLLGGKTILEHTIERFLSSGLVEQVIVAVSHDRLQPAREHVLFVEGGATRQQSVTNALHVAGEHELVAVHDSVRPFFRTELLRQLLATAQRHGAALPVAAVTDTIHEISGGLLRATLDRSKLGAAQTPQCFRTTLLREVLSRAAARGESDTDEAGLAARYGITVLALPGSPDNFKITTAEDLDRAEHLLGRWSDR